MACGAPLAGDQRYCLHCGERRAAVSAFLRTAEPAVPSPPATPPGPPPTLMAAPARAGRGDNALTVIAGVGVLLLAMGVGVLIGRAGGAKQVQASPEVITVGMGAGTGATTGATEESLTGDWPVAMKGYTVQLQTLPQEGTSEKAVEQAKAEAGAKGASSVGALKSEDFSSLTSGSYIVYSGVYHRRSEATKALDGLKKKFPSARVIEVSNGSADSGSGGGGGAGSGTGSSLKHPAPPSVLDSLNGSKGKSYEEKSKALPDVVSTG